MPMHLLQPTLNGGEAAPGLWHRVDLQKFTTWVRQAINFFVRPQGGLCNRPGTKMLAAAKKNETYTKQETVNLYAWSVTGYTDQWIYYSETETPTTDTPLYKNDGVEPTCTITAVDLTSNPPTITVSDGSASRTVLRMNTYNTTRTVTRTLTRSKGARLIPFVFSKTQAYTLELGVGYIRFYTSNGLVLDANDNVYEVATDFTAAELPNIYYCQVADVMYFACAGRAPKQLARYGHTDWKFSDYDYNYGPLKLQNADEKLKISANWNSTDNKYYLTCENDVFCAEDVGAWWKIVHTLKSTHFQQSYGSQSSVTSDPMLMTHELMVQTTGTWAGSIKIQYSNDKDDSNSWKTLRAMSSVMHYDPAAQQDISSFNANDTISIPAGIYWVRVVPEITNGTCYFTIDCDEQQVDIFYKVAEYISPMKVAVNLINETKGLETYFGSGREYKSCIPTFTSGTAPSGTYSSLQADFWHALDGKNDTVFTMKNNATVDHGGFTYAWPSGSAVVITSIAILGHNIEGALGEATQGDKIIMTPSSGSFVVRSIERGEEVTFTADGQTYTETWRIFNVKPIVSTSISFAVSADSTSSNTSPKHLVRFVVRGYDYVAGQEITINATAQWSQGAWSTKNGWPTCVAQHGGRLMWGQEDGVQGTQIGNYNSFATSYPLEDSDGISTTLRDEGINAVNALASMKSLLAFTAGGVFASNSAVMTPSDAGMPKQSGAGGGAVRPVVIGTRVLYVLPKTGKLFDSAYDYSTDAFNGGDLCLIAEHLFENEQVVEMAYQQEPYGLLWVVLASGKLLCLTYVQSENVCAWTQMQTDGQVESVCCIPGAVRDELFLLVKRDGTRYVEKMADRLASKAPAEQFFVDCGRTYRGDPATAITGLDYLEGKEVAILADGKVVPNQTVTNGQITLTTAASVVHVGLPYTAVLRTLAGDLNTDTGSVLAKKKRYVGAMVSFIDSSHAQVGCKESRMEEWLPAYPLTYDTATQLISEDKSFTFQGNYETMPSIIVKQLAPMPLTIAAIMPKAQVGNV